jgi:signal transduction histidine kinase
MQSRALTVRFLWLAIAAAFVLPCLLLAYGSWVSYRSNVALADERITRALDVQREQAVKAFESIELALDNADELVAGMSEDEIRANEERLHLQFVRLIRGISAIQSAWIYGSDGHALVSSRAHPPPTQSYADRDFVRAHLAEGKGTYYGEVARSQFNGLPFFTASRRLTRNGAFAGVIEISILPSNFVNFYSTLAYTKGLQYGLLREDGLFLARYPSLPQNVSERLGDNTRFRQTVTVHPEGGFYDTVSPVDGIARRFGVRRFGDTGLYFTAGISRDDMQRAWLSGMAPHLIFGVPATLLLVTTLYLVLRRTERLYAEVDRRVAAEDTVRQTQKIEAIGQLTGGIAHDFNNLLTIIIGNLEGAQTQVTAWASDSQVKALRRLDNAMQGAQRAATLTKRLLAFARQQPLQPVPLDINRLLNGTSDFLKRALGESHSLEIVGGAGVWPVEADATELETAILNLALNGRDAMPAGGNLTIETSNAYLDENYCAQNGDVHSGQYSLLSVTDTGTGMPKDVVARAFDPFFTTKPTGQGTGLGLSQVYGFVKQSGGHAKIYSEVGEGTTVKIYLRRFHGEASTADVKPSEPPRGATGECVLVVEDDPDVRSYVVETLQGLGYDVLHAENGKAALALAQQYKGIRLLLTDVVMPGMNGRQLADAARANMPELKVLYMTGYSRNAIIHQGRLDPGVALIQKPVTSAELAAMVRRTLDSDKPS